MEFQDSKMGELDLKIKLAEKLADEHEYKLLQQRYSKLLSSLHEMQNSPRKSPEYYRTNYELKKVKEKMEKYEKDNNVTDAGFDLRDPDPTGRLVASAVGARKAKWPEVYKSFQKAPLSILNKITTLHEARNFLVGKGYRYDDPAVYEAAERFLGDNAVTDAGGPDKKFNAFIQKHGWPTNYEESKALLEKAKKEGIHPDYIHGMERGLRAITHKDNDATENGAIEQYGQNKETEKMEPQKEPIQAQDSEAKQVQDSFDMLKLMGII